MNTLLSRMARWADRTIEVALALAAVALLMLVLLTFQQVVARYLFGGGSVAMQELEWHLFGFAFLVAAAGTLRHRQHVRVDIFYNRWSPRTQAWIELLGFGLFFAPFCLVLIWYGTDFTLAAMAWSTSGQPQTLWGFLPVGESSADPGGLPARWLIKACIPLSGLLLLAAGLRALAGPLRALRGQGE